MTSQIEKIAEPNISEYAFYRGNNFNSYAMHYCVKANSEDQANEKVIELWKRSSERDNLPVYPIPKFTLFAVRAVAEQIYDKGQA